MRYHKAVLALASWSTHEMMQSVVSVSSLVAARVEPVMRQGKPALVVDMQFRRDEARVVIPLVFADVSMLLERERDPLVWPAVVEGGVDAGAAKAISERLLPDLRRRTLGRAFNDEMVLHFGDADDVELFEAARLAQMLGAAPLAHVARRASPFVYALRFCGGADVQIDVPDGDLAWAILRRHARRARVNAGALAAPDLSRRWYGEIEAQAPPDWSPDLYIDTQPRAAHGHGVHVRIGKDAREDEYAVRAADELACDVLFAFASDEGFVTERAYVSLPVPVGVALGYEHRPRRRVRGSSGRVLFAMRHDYEDVGDADVDEARALAGELREEGLDVVLSCDPQEVGRGRYDVVHVHGLHDPAAALSFLRAGRRCGAVTVLRPHFEDPPGGGFWGALVTPHCFDYSADEGSVQSFLQLLREERLALGNVRAETRHGATPQYEGELREALSLVDVALVAEAREAAAIAAYGFHGCAIEVSPPVMPDTRLHDIGHLTGSEPFVLMHAPIGPHANQLMAVRAAEICELPLVISGPVADFGYLALVREFAGPQTRLLPELEPAQTASLYGAASVFLDVSWVGRGLARLARAVLWGFAPVLSHRRFAAAVLEDDECYRASPGDLEAIARAIGDAWYAGRRKPGARACAATAPESVVAATLRGYLAGRPAHVAAP